jgi:hypothetical protein
MSVPIIKDAEQRKNTPRNPQMAAEVRVDQADGVEPLRRRDARGNTS